MPSSTAKQAHFMGAVAHGWKPTGEKGPAQAQAQEWHQEDKKVGKYEHPRGSGGKMERLKGKAHTSAERSHKHRHGKGGRF